MTLFEIAFFAVTLFLALAALLIWKRRRDALNARVSKGLRGYVASAPAVQHEESNGEELQVA